MVYGLIQSREKRVFQKDDMVAGVEQKSNMVYNAGGVLFELKRVREGEWCDKLDKSMVFMCEVKARV
jgi:hypothetical protein